MIAQSTLPNLVRSYICGALAAVSLTSAIVTLVTVLSTTVAKADLVVASVVVRADASTHAGMWTDESTSLGHLGLMLDDSAGRPTVGSSGTRGDAVLTRMAAGNNNNVPRGANTSSRGSSYSSAHSRIDRAMMPDANKAHPLAATDPKYYIVVCEAGCHHGEDEIVAKTLKVTYVAPEGSFEPTSATIDSIDDEHVAAASPASSADRDNVTVRHQDPALILCLAGCYASVKSYPAMLSTRTSWLEPDAAIVTASTTKKAATSVAKPRLVERGVNGAIVAERVQASVVEFAEAPPVSSRRSGAPTQTLAQTLPRSTVPMPPLTAAAAHLSTTVPPPSQPRLLPTPQSGQLAALPSSADRTAMRTSQGRLVGLSAAASRPALQIERLRALLGRGRVTLADIPRRPRSMRQVDVAPTRFRADLWPNRSTVSQPSSANIALMTEAVSDQP